jgi:hypothetical protein
LWVNFKGKINCILLKGGEILKIKIDRAMWKEKKYLNLNLVSLEKRVKGLSNNTFIHYIIAEI